MVKLVGTINDDSFNLNGTEEEITAEAGAGIDTIRLTGDLSVSRLTLDASSGVERLDLGHHYLTGSAGDDVFDISGISSIVGDFLDSDYGVGDNGFLRPGEGNDTVIGHSGRDLIDGGPGNDLLRGGLGDDWFVSSLGNDVFDGGGGSDRLVVYGLWSVSELNLGSGASIETLDLEWGSLTGTDADDSIDLSGVGHIRYYDDNDDISVIELLGGNDRFIGSTYGDFVDGGDGNDLLDVRGGGGSVRGGGGDDVIYGGARGDELVGEDGSDSIEGGAGDDTVNGGAGDDVVHGGEGNDYLSGSLGNDLMEGGSGHDTLVGGAGDDELHGGEGDDTFVISGDSGNDKIDGGAGYDSLSLGGSSKWAAIDASTFTGIEKITFYKYTLLGTNGANTFDLRWVDALVDQRRAISLQGGNDKYIGSDGRDWVDGGSDNDDLSGGTGSDILSGGRGNDRLKGGKGNDSLSGGVGRDILDGGTGADSLYGEGGDDTYIVDNRGDQVTEAANGGKDIVRASVSFSLSDNVEDLTLTGKGNFSGTGNASRNIIVGNSGINALDGGKGNDVLKGAAGNDKFVGGRGGDDLYGGAGKDTFVFKALADSTNGASGRDTIFDFSQKQGDRIHLSAIDAKYSTIRNEGFKFIGDDKFSKESGEVRYQKKGGDTYIYGDVDADGKADFSIHLDGLFSLRSGDFIL